MQYDRTLAEFLPLSTLYWFVLRCCEMVREIVVRGFITRLVDAEKNHTNNALLILRLTGARYDTGYIVDIRVEWDEVSVLYLDLDGISLDSSTGNLRVYSPFIKSNAGFVSLPEISLTSHWDLDKSTVFFENSNSRLHRQTISVIIFIITKAKHIQLEFQLHF